MVAALLAIAVTLLVTRSIVDPLRRITRAAERISEGDIAVGTGLPAAGETEIGRLARAFRGTVEYLSEMVGVAEQVAGGNLALTVRPRSERDVVGQAFARMRDRLATMIENIARSSSAVGVASTEMAQTSQQAGQAVGEIAGAIGAVAEGAESQVRSLGQARGMTAEVASACERALRSSPTRCATSPRSPGRRLARSQSSSPRSSRAPPARSRR